MERIEVYKNLYTKVDFKEDSLLSLDGGAQYTLSDNTLIFDDSIHQKGATIWIKKKMPKNYTVCYKAKAIDPELAGNLNLFLSAKTIDGLPPDQVDLGGLYGNYHQQCEMYILTLTGAFEFENSSNAGYTRFRKDPGFHLISENQEIITRHNQEQTFEITKRDGKIQVFIDSQLAHLFIDENPIEREGFFGIRTYKTKAFFYDFEVYSDSES